MRKGLWAQVELRWALIAIYFIPQCPARSWASPLEYMEVSDRHWPVYGGTLAKGMWTCSQECLFARADGHCCFPGLSNIMGRLWKLELQQSSNFRACTSPGCQLSVCATMPIRQMQIHLKDYSFWLGNIPPVQADRWPNVWENGHYAQGIQFSNTLFTRSVASWLLMREQRGKRNRKCNDEVKSLLVFVLFYFL